jgi:hypothetical protein
MLQINCGACRHVGPADHVERRARQPVADFYKGKQIRMVVRTTPGGDYDQYSRLLARFMGKHIPAIRSSWSSTCRAAAAVAANYMAQVAPRDGTVVGIVSQGLAADQALACRRSSRTDLARVQLDRQWSIPTNCWWCGTPRRPRRLRMPSIASPPSAPGAGSRLRAYPAFYSNVLGQVQDLVFGYPVGQHIDLAMERGEGRRRAAPTYSGWMASKPTWIHEADHSADQAGVEKSRRCRTCR